jgi:prepilin-type N-terminal cleavage/methylation domain-containing protein
MKTHRPRFGTSAFSLPELVLTLAIIGLLAGMVVNSFSNLQSDSSRMIARQQQKTLQNAVDAWVASETRSDTDGSVISLETVRSEYNSRGTTKARFNLAGPYLDDGTFKHFDESSVNSGKIQSDALKRIKHHLTLDTWGATTYPKVLMVAD